MAYDLAPMCLLRMLAIDEQRGNIESRSTAATLMLSGGQVHNGADAESPRPRRILVVDDEATAMAADGNQAIDLL